MRFYKDRHLKNIYIGMELDDHEVRAVEMDFSHAIPRILHAGRIRLENSTVIDGMVKNPQQLANHFKALWEKEGFSSDKVLLGISSQDVLIRFASMVKMEDSKIKNLIRFQSQDYFPVSIQDYAMDFMKLGEKPQAHQSSLDIVIVACKNAMIRGYTQAMELAGLNPYEVDISPLSIMKYAEHEGNEDTLILANISYGKMDLLLLKNRMPIFAKTAHFSSSCLFAKEESSSAANPPEYPPKDPKEVSEYFPGLPALTSKSLPVVEEEVFRTSNLDFESYLETFDVSGTQGKDTSKTPDFDLVSLMEPLGLPDTTLPV